MRLNRLDLTRYGKFTDLSLSFPKPSPGAPDLHLIYGANEAGKSTLLEAWLDLLFQIPVRSNMDFMHPYPSMLLGAELEIDNRSFDLRRVKKRDNSLLDGNGAPVGEALLHGGLRGLDRASYAAMFSLNRHTLSEGGESILASKGDLGELLFQASAGLNDLTSQLGELREETEEFLNRTGRKGKLRDLGQAFDDLGRQIKDLDTVAAEFARLSKERDGARLEWESAREAVEIAQTKVLEIDRLKDALPLLPRLERLDAQISEFAGLTEPPEGWLAELPELDRKEAAFSTRLDTAREAVNSLDTELKRLVTDEAILDLREQIATVEDLKSAHDEAIKDLPRRSSDLASKTEAIEESLSRLGKTGAEPSTLILEVGIVGRFRELIEQNSGLKARRNAASQEFDDAQESLKRATRRLNDAGGTASDLGGLDALVQSIRRTDPSGALDRATERLEEMEAELTASLTSLAPWSGDVAELTKLVKPENAIIDRLASDIAEAEREFDRAKAQMDHRELARDQAKAKLDAIGAATVVSIEEAAQIRAQRELDWSQHRAALTEETADRFEKAMRLDDQVMSTLGQQRAQAEKATGAGNELIEAERLLDSAMKQMATATSNCSMLSEKLATIVSSMSDTLPAEMKLPAFRAWLDRLDAAHKVLEQRNRAVRELNRHKLAFDHAKTDLLAALAHVGLQIPEQPSFALMLETAQSVLDRATRIEALREAEAQARENVVRRKSAVQTELNAMERWQADWDVTCADTWMAGTAFGASEMRAILEELDRLRDQHREVSDLSHRIETMQVNRERFEQSVQDLARRLNMASDEPIPDLWRAVSKRLRAAETNEARRADVSKRLSKAVQGLTELEELARIHQTRTAEFASHFGVGTWVAAREALTRAGELSRLRNARKELAEDLCTRMRSNSVEQAQAKLQGLDADALVARATSLEDDLKELRSIQENAQDTFRKAHDAVEAVGGDGAVARLEEQRQTLLLEMEDGARRYMRQRLGLLAVDAAVRSYRDTHRSGMLERASEAFRIMTRNSYSGLAAQPDGTDEILVALAAEGASKQADQLSDGTRAQLYLALRIAGYHEFSRNNGPVPFIADDIMESFDDGRTAETFALLTEMSKTGQVIYLTHHRHLLDIARDACPTFYVQKLPA